MMEGSDFRPGKTGVFSLEWPLIATALVLSCIGICMIFSATVPLGEAGRSFVIRQAVWLSFGIVLMAVFLLFDYRVLDQWGLWLYVAIIVALVVVWTVGKVTAGSRRWIELGMMRFQPSEFAKLAVVIVLAKYFQRRQEPLQAVELLKPALLVLVPVTLVLIQPDLGTAGVILLIALSMVAFVGLERKLLLWLGGAAAVALPLVMLLSDRLLMEYQRKRLMTYLDPANDPLGAGYHILQSQIAIGSGGMWGKGFLKGTQNQLMFLPVKHTDFVFSILAEEWGYAGCLVLLALMSALIMRGMSVTKTARDSFGTLLAFGCTAAFFWHVLINAGMVMGLVPVVGVPLSFVSYGGSSLLVSFLAISIMANVSMRRFSY